MTLTTYKDHQELFNGAVLHFTGVSETNLGFPILPAGVTVTPSGTWSNPLDLGTNKVLKTFDGSTNYISLTDSASWDIFESNFTICGWIKRLTSTAGFEILSQVSNGSNYWTCYLDPVGNTISLVGTVSGTNTFSYHAANTADLLWHFITIQRYGTSCLMSVDGVYKTVNISVAFTGITNISTVLKILKSNIPGNIKDLLIYKGRALSLPELTTIMRLSHPTTGRNDFYPLISPRGVE